MSGTLSKRQQARNERTLQELIKTVPGNNVCADCQARNPGWASWSLGIFLCMRCAALHRKLGTHISKVKSLSMDSWSNEQVENMKRTGNVASNRIFNPQNAKPPIPFDADEVDSAMERFIRQKYQDNTLRGGRTQAAARHDTGTTASTESDDNPPPLPPKTGGKFGFRSASSIFPMSSKAKREAAARAHLEAERERRRSPSPPMRNKASRVFGAAVGSENSSGEDLDSKLATLRQMGFKNEKQNSTILKEQGGNLEKTIETLVKSGETDPSSRSRTPLSATAGISIQRTHEQESPKVSKNPFDMPSAAPQSSQSTGTLAHQNPQYVNGNQSRSVNGSNPFGLAPSQSQSNLHQQYSIDQSLQSMSLGHSQQLFPNHTGGFPNRQPYQAAGTSPMPTIPQNYTPNVFDNQQQQQQVHQIQNHNPFLQQQTPQNQAFNQAVNNAFSANPYAPQQRTQTYPLQTYFDQAQQQQPYLDQNQQVQSPQQYQQPQSPQQQTNPYGSQMQLNQQYPQSPQQQNNPYGAQMHQSQQYPQSPQQQNNPYGAQMQQNQQFPQVGQQFMQFSSQHQQLLPQQTERADKTSILALYNYPHLAPVSPQIQSPVEMNQTHNPNTQGFSGAGMQNQQQQRSASSPLAAYNSANRNPFLNSGGGFSQGHNGNAAQAVGTGNGMNGTIRGQVRHVSQESMNVDVGGWHGQNGRHSPDAFANLSARSMR